MISTQSIKEPIILFLNKYIERGLETFTLFEQIFSQLVFQNLKNMSYKEFMQIQNTDCQHFLNIDSERRENNIPKEVTPQDIEEIKNKKNISYEELHWLNLNESNSGNRWNKWDEFYNSLSEGYGTIGFEDYRSGITVRGALTPIENTGSLILCVEIKHNSLPHFLQKTHTLKSLRTISGINVLSYISHNSDALELLPYC